MKKNYTIMVGRGLNFAHGFFRVNCTESEIETICLAHYHFAQNKTNTQLMVAYCEGETWNEKKAVVLIDCM